MLRNDENYVALFIDWDNLAISIAADFGGVTPDVKALVKAAQRHGTLLQARAYAEWQVNSDRLTVYREGVEPVFAPTFRFEPDPVTMAPRGKSLADPCLVADCVDTMHLMPLINIFVLVSGDKDLIPIVRLAQMRGKRVVVIGPEYVAAVLRDMADEYVPYRQLIETPESPLPEPPARGRRRVPGGSHHGQARSTATAASLPPIPGATPLPIRGPTGGRQQHRPALPPQQARPSPAATTAYVAPEAEARPEPEPEYEAPTTESEETVEATADPAQLFSTIEAILRERDQLGKPRLRATNLKDQLLARIPGFNERQYGFVRYKDLLNAAERAGVLTVSRTGPVQWVQLPGVRRGEGTPAAATPEATGPAATAAAEAPPAPTEPAATTATEAAAPTAATAPADVPPTVRSDDDRSLIRYVADLRNRSRWLTYTYVLTNLVSLLAQDQAPGTAEAEARNAVNHLVQEGILVVDREPREIDVGGAKHRVRLCHLNEQHPTVVAALSEAAEQPPAGAPEDAGETPAGEVPRAFGMDTSTDVAVTDQPGARPAAVSPTGEVEHEQTAIEGQPPTLPAELVTTSDAEYVVSTGQPDARSAEDGVERLDEQTEVPPPATPIEAMADAAATAMLAPSTQPESPAIGQEPALQAAPPAGEAGTKPSLAEVFSTLRTIMAEATGPDKPSAGASGVKNRLTRALGTFDERDYGFSKFKDFLTAAERAGIVRLEGHGPVTRVFPAGVP